MSQRFEAGTGHQRVVPLLHRGRGRVATLLYSNAFLFLNKMTTRLGIRITSVSENAIDMEDEFKELYEKCKGFTMTSIERMYSLYKAVEYVVRFEIPGDFVECGVWEGGSCMLMAQTLARKGDLTRKIFLYDTYTGMARPTEEDYTLKDGHQAVDIWRRDEKEGYNKWCYVPLDEVRRNVLSTGYPEERLVFVKGMVEDTIPRTTPKAISILRLDTDWYESTLHALRHMYPLLVERGALIIDDYGVWAGARKAVDEYLAENKISMLLNRIDYTGRVGIKFENSRAGER